MWFFYYDTNVISLKWHKTKLVTRPTEHIES